VVSVADPPKTATTGVSSDASSKPDLRKDGAATVTPAFDAFDGLAKLTAPFPPERIGKLPKRQKQPDGSFKEIELEYVGHADVTERLLSVDPEWNWEPMGYAPDGLPAMITTPDGHPIGLWIKLTVCGVTRIGFGSVPPGGFEAEKQLISDALRNAAMRFGVALDLWRKDAPQENGHAEAAASPAPGGANARPTIRVMSRVATGRVCPDCGGDLELVRWDNGKAAVCCVNWKQADGGCKHRELAESVLPMPEEIRDDTPIPFA
jgi:hypothetical protein